MALMAYYCETHRWAWPIADGADPPKCPAVGPRCKVQSVDTIGKINDLGLEIVGLEDEPEGG